MASGSARPEAANCPELGPQPGEMGPLWDRMAQGEVEQQLLALRSASPLMLQPLTAPPRPTAAPWWCPVPGRCS